jgi:8-oxo-dGTP pyrophosphatase MutT (NUDIX family)
VEKPKKNPNKPKNRKKQARKKIARDYEQLKSAGGFMYAIIDGKPKIILIKNRFTKRWVMPKGKLDPGETVEQAAVREVEEETGVKGRILEYLGQNRFFFSFGKKRYHKTVDVYFMEAVGDTKLDPAKFDPHDKFVSDARWFDPDKVAGALPYVNLRPMAKKAARKAKEMARG